MIAADEQKGIGKPIISVIETTRFGILGDIRSHGLLGKESDRKSKDFPVSLIDNKDDPFTRCSPTTLTRSLATEHGFTHSNFTREVLVL